MTRNFQPDTKAVAAQACREIADALTAAHNEAMAAGLRAVALLPIDKESAIRGALKGTAQQMRELAEYYEQQLQGIVI